VSADRVVGDRLLIDCRAVRKSTFRRVFCRTRNNRPPRVGSTPAGPVGANREADMLSAAWSLDPSGRAER
jgi:hypothetical protein